MIKILLLSYVFFVSWTGVFALGEWIRLPFIFALLSVALVSIDIVIKGKFDRRPYRMEDFFIVLFLISMVLSATCNPNALSLNYIAAYCFIFGVLYLFIKNALYTYVPVDSIYAINSFAVVFVGAFMSINFVLGTMGVIDLQAMLPRIRDTTAMYSGLFNRGYGFSTEPSIVAFYIDTLGPLAVWYIWYRSGLQQYLKFILTVFIAIGWLVTFSASAVASLTIGIVCAVLLSLLTPGKTRFWSDARFRTFLLLAVFIAIMIWIFFQFNLGKYLAPIYMKLTLSSDLASSSSRLDRWAAGFNRLVEVDNPLTGYGPGYFSSIDQSSTLSWYFMVLVEGGILSFLFIMIFLGLVLGRIVKMRHSSRPAFLVGFIAGCAHLLVISTFYHPFLWLLLAILYVQLAVLQKQAVIKSVEN